MYKRYLIEVSNYYIIIIIGQLFILFTSVLNFVILRNISTKHSTTLLRTTCCTRLPTLLQYVAACCMMPSTCTLFPRQRALLVSKIMKIIKIADKSQYTVRPQF